MEYNEANHLSCSVSSSIYHYYLSGEVGCSALYIGLLEALADMREGDVMYLHVNTPGGSIDTAVQIIDSILDCKGEVITCAEGQVASVGSLIFFSGHGFKVGRFCEVLLHDGSSGFSGKFSESLASARSCSDRVKALYHSVYGRFFPKSEVDKVLEGVDRYILADELKMILDAYVLKLKSM